MPGNYVTPSVANHVASRKIDIVPPRRGLEHPRLGFATVTAILLAVRTHLKGIDRELPIQLLVHGGGGGWIDIAIADIGLVGDDND